MGGRRPPGDPVKTSNCREGPPRQRPRAGLPFDPTSRRVFPFGLGGQTIAHAISLGEIIAERQGIFKRYIWNRDIRYLWTYTAKIFGAELSP